MSRAICVAGRVALWDPDSCRVFCSVLISFILLLLLDCDDDVGPRVSYSLAGVPSVVALAVFVCVCLTGRR